MKKLWSTLPLAVALLALYFSISRNRTPEPASQADSVVALAPQLRDQRPESVVPMTGDVDSRLDALSWTVSGLVQRLNALEKQGPAIVAGGSAVDAQQLQALRREVDSLLTGQAYETEAGQGRLKELVRNTPNEVFADRIRERMTEMDKDRVERLKKFFDSAGLGSSQSQQISAALDKETQKRREVFEQAQNGQFPGREGFAQMRAVRDETDALAKNILSADQYTQFSQLREDDRGQRRGGGNGRQNR